MAQFPSLPETAHLTDLLVRFPKNIRPLMTYVNAVMRSEGALSVGERELIAAYVSGLNACTFCYGSHTIYARAFGIPEGLLEQLVENVEAADIEPKMKPLLAYVAKLNRLPSRLVSADSQAVFDAGWSEEALFEANEVAGLFNLMNRMVEGGGVNFDYADNPEQHSIQTPDPAALANSYLGYADRLEKLAAEKSGA